MIKLHGFDRVFSGRNAATLLRVLVGLLVVAIVLHAVLTKFSRPRFNLMYDARCVPMKSNHLDPNYMKEDACFSRRQIQSIITDLVLDTSVVFDAYNLTFFLDSGTLLGSYRTGSPIPHDQDADMGMDERSFEFIQKNPIAMHSKYALFVFDSEIHEGGYRDKELPIRIVHKASALYIDVFVYVDRYDPTKGRVTGPIPSACYAGCKSCPRVGQGQWLFQVPYDWIYPLQSCSFAHRLFKCPAQPEKYLRYMFGDDFMTPAYEY